MRTNDLNVHGIVLASALFGALIAATASCAPEPEYAHCRNNAMCEERDPEKAICENGRCVECIADFTCGKKAKCVDGICEP